jgi:hypothetical protein
VNTIVVPGCQQYCISICRLSLSPQRGHPFTFVAAFVLFQGMTMKLALAMFSSSMGMMFAAYAIGVINAPQSVSIHKLI